MKPSSSGGMRVAWRGLLLLLVLLGACRGWRGVHARRSLEDERRAQAVRVDDLESRRRQGEAQVQALRAEAESARRDAALAAARWADATAREFEERIAPRSLHEDSTPPVQRPAWNPESEFVWVAKSALARWPIPGVQEDGALTAEAMVALGLPEEQAQRLNDRLRALLVEFHVQDRANARVVAEHLPGIAEKEGRKLTVRADLDPELARSMRARFQRSLREELGEERSGIVHEWAEEWLAEQFPLGPGVARIISVVRHPDGAYTLRSGLGDQGFLFSGPMRLEDYVPRHLISLFDPVTREGAAAVGNAIRD